MESQINQQPLVQEQPVLSYSASHSKIPLIAAIMLLLGVAIGYLLFANKNTASNTITQAIQISPTTTQSEPTPIPTTVPVSNAVTTTPQNGAALNAIRYTLPITWEAKLENNALMLSPKVGGGYFLIKIYDYAGTLGRRENYCKITTYCIEGTTKFTEMRIGNIAGYMASGLDNSAGGVEYFAAKGNKFYVLSSYNQFNPGSPNEFVTSNQQVLDSLIF